MTPSAIFLATCWLIGGVMTTHNLLYEDIGLNDKVFTDNITFQSPAKHELDCARQCSQKDSCVTFTFHNNTCRGHGALMTSCSNCSPVSEARSYTRERKARCKKTGVTRVRDPSLGLDMDVFCQDDWMVFQKRQDGSVDFFRTWDEYSTGFGDMNGEYWLGLETLHCITTRGVTYDLRVDLMKLDGTNGSAFYSNFSVGSAADNYPLHYDSFQGGSAADALTVSHDKPFSTWDADHDELGAFNMASFLQTGWWFAMAVVSNLNGHYSINTPNMPDGIVWATFSSYDSLKSCQMMIRPVN